MRAVLLLMTACAPAGAVMETVPLEEGRPTKPPRTGIWTFPDTGDTSPPGETGDTGGGTASPTLGCLTFTGGPDLVVAPDAGAPSGTAAFTIEARVHVAVVGEGYVVSWGTWAAEQVVLFGLVQQYPDTAMRPYFYAGTAPTTLLGEPVVTASRWTHLVMNRDASGYVQLYVDGAIVAGGPMTLFSIVPSGRLVLGNNVDTGGLDRPFVGTVDFVRVWDGWVDGAALYASPPPEVAPGNLPIAYELDGSGSGAGRPIRNSGVAPGMDGTTEGTPYSPLFVDCANLP